MSQASSMTQKTSILHEVGDLSMASRLCVFQSASMLLTAMNKQASERPGRPDPNQEQSTQRLIGKMPQQPFCRGNLWFTSIRVKDCFNRQIILSTCKF